MATFRSSAGVMVATWCLACAPPSATETPIADVAAIARQRIEHVTPKRDFVGAAPARLEWTAVEGVDSYTVTVMNEVDARLLDYHRATGTSIDWPKEIKLEPGTYYWRVVGVKDGRRAADSGRAAFVVTE
jgi:hypothetical protein